MAICKNCQRDLKDYRKGYCQKCYRDKADKNNVKEAANMENAWDDKILNILNTQNMDMNLSGISLNQDNTKFCNPSLARNDVTETEESCIEFSNTDATTAPQSVQDLFDIFIKMKNEFQSIVKSKDEAIMALTVRVTQLEEGAKKDDTTRIVEENSKLTKRVTMLEEEAKKINQVAEVTDKIEKIEQEIGPQRDAIRHHQKYLESIANKDRGKNLIITGVAELESEDIITIVNNVITHITPKCGNVAVDAVEIEAVRLGNPETSRKPRPILVKLTNKVLRNEICKHSKTLININGFEKIYVKRDTHPALRKEHSRLHKLVKDERKKPENQGTNIVYDMKNGVVKRDDLVIDTYRPHF